LIVVGAGAVGVEFASIYNSFGTQVTILEALPRVVPVEDEEISAELTKAFQKRGIQVFTSCAVESVKKDAKGVTVAFKDKDGNHRRCRRRSCCWPWDEADDGELRSGEIEGQAGARIRHVSPMETALLGCHASAHVTNPRSSLAFDFSRPQFSVIGFRPTASSSFSACSVCGFPSLSLNATVTPFASFSPTPLRNCENLDASFLKGLGQLRGNFFVLDRHNTRQRFQDRHLRPERIVNGRKIPPPTAPAPTTIKVFGISGSWRIERFVRMVLWSGSMPGSDFASEPLTIRMFAASISVFFPSFSRSRAPSPHTFPALYPLHLVLLEENSMPFECFLTILSFRERTFAQLISAR